MVLSQIYARLSKNLNLRTFDANFVGHDLRTFSANYDQLKKQNPPTFLLLECMVEVKGWHWCLSGGLKACQEE